MPIIPLKSKKKFLAELKLPHLQHYRVETVIDWFKANRRRKQIAFAKEGCNVLRQHIGDKAEGLEERGQLEFRCFFDNVKGDMQPLGILANYVERGKGKLLWWEP